jgi:voltage-gated potassium channel
MAPSPWRRRSPTVPHRLKKQSFREALNEVMSPYEPGGRHPRLSLFVDLFVLVCIVASCVLVVLELFYPTHHDVFLPFEIGFTLIFIIEYGLRWYSAERRWRYPFTFFAVIDLLAILPTLLMVGADLLLLRAVRGIRLLRLLRLLRLIRLLKFIRYGFLIYRGMVSLRTWFFSVSYQYRLRSLARLFLWTFLSWVVGTNIVYFTEARLAPPNGPFADYWNSYWHMIIVLVSGIEDKEPLSLLGRVEMTVLLIVGICIVGMLTGEIVAILVKKAQRAGKIALKPPVGKLAQHILILGSNSHLDNVVRQVHAATNGQHYILIVSPDADQLMITDPEVYKMVFGLAGDPVRLDILEAAYVDEAFRVIILADENADQPRHLLDGEKLMQMLAVVGQRRQVPIVVEVLDPDSASDAAALGDIGVEFLLVRHYGEGLISQAVLNPGVTKVYTQLMTFTSDTNEVYTVPVPPRFVGKRFDEVQLELLDNDSDNIVLIGIDRSTWERPNTRFVLNPMAEECNCSDEDLVLSEGDNIVVLAFERPSFAKIDKEDLWSGKVLKRT